MTNAKKPKNENYYRSIYDDYKPLVVFIASIYLTNKDYIDDVVQENGAGLTQRIYIVA